MNKAHPNKLEVVQPNVVHHAAVFVLQPTTPVAFPTLALAAGEEQRRRERGVSAGPAVPLERTGAPPGLRRGRGGLPILIHGNSIAAMSTKLVEKSVSNHQVHS